MQDLHENKKPFVITVANEKGGVGKSTTSLAVGTLLARRGSRVLFIDLDPQCNLTLSLGFKPHQMSSQSEALSTTRLSLADTLFRTEVENIDLFFARLLVIDDENLIRASVGDDSHNLSQDLRALAGLRHDYHIIDCPPLLGKLTLDACMVSDFLIIPTQADFYSSFALKDMMGLVDRVRHSGNPGLFYSILITLFDKRNRIHHDVRKQLRHTFGSGLFQTVIGLDADLRKASLLGFPTNNTRGVMQYRKLVDELLASVQKDLQETSNPSR